MLCARAILGLRGQSMDCTTNHGSGFEQDNPGIAQIHALRVTRKQCQLKKKEKGSLQRRHYTGSEQEAKVYNLLEIHVLPVWFVCSTA